VCDASIAHIYPWKNAFFQRLPLIGSFRLRGANDKLPVVACGAITTAAAATTTRRRHGF
jgi:hypothetical protein